MVLQRRPYGVHWEAPSGYHEPGESLEAAAALEGGELHPFRRTILGRWWTARETGFRIHADALPYAFRT
jgi:hypothetical protein